MDLLGLPSEPGAVVQFQPAGVRLVRLELHPFFI